MKYELIGILIIYAGITGLWLNTKDIFQKRLFALLMVFILAISIAGAIMYINISHMEHITCEKD
jgi:hypothetical protein